MHICFITNLSVWSLGKGKGAPSFYNTLQLYNNRGDTVTLLTTENGLDLSELDNVQIVYLAHRKLLQSRLLGGLVRLLHKYFLYIRYQIDGVRALNKHASEADIIYAYEIGFVPAVKIFCQQNKKKWVSRFQGTILTDLVQASGLMRKVRLYCQFFDHIAALKTLSPLTIMTDDGTRGDQVLKFLRRTSLHARVDFFKNGVDSLDLNVGDLESYEQAHNTNDIVFSSVSRVQRWKRLDRSVEIFEVFTRTYPKSHYYIAGEGPELENIKELVVSKKLEDKITFLGSLKKSQIYQLLMDSKYFLSSYELSNLGNPLYEAICCSTIVATLDNGSTSEMIEDQVTGVLSREGEYIINGEKLVTLESNQALQQAINAQAQRTFSRAMVSWDQRMDKEYLSLMMLRNEP